MAMYYYASKLNEASCSGCNMKVPPAPSEPAPVPPPPTDLAPLPPDPSLLHGTGLSYYDVSFFTSLLMLFFYLHIMPPFEDKSLSNK